MNQNTINNLLKRGATLVSSSGMEIVGRDDGLIGVTGGEIVYQPKAFWDRVESWKGIVDVTWQVK